MAISEYRFGNFRLVPATRELWRDGELVHAPRRGFDCLAYLIEHRERAVGRDEMVAALWGRVDVTDSQVNQVVLRARLAVGDDGQTQSAIRTVPGFGYRWIVPVEAVEAAGEADHEIPSAPTIAVDYALPAAPTAAPVSAAPRRDHGRWRSVTVALLGGAALLGWLFWSMRPAPLTEMPRTALVVLPLEVPAASESGWIRLGAMDLAAERLRNAGLAVPPSDSVVSAVHAVGEPLDPARRETLQKTLGAATLVQGKVSRSASGWSVELEAQDGDGTRHRTTADQADVIEATRQAADLLAAALGRQPAPGDEREGDSVVRAALQRAQAALLANQLDTARSILAGLPDPARADPQVRAKRAQIDFRAGDLESARTTLDALLADPELAARADVRAQALTTRGFIDIRHEDCAAAETRFDGAVSALPERTSRQRGIALAARGLARACLHRFDAAVADLGAARTQLIAVGDRLGNARVDNYFGILETQRHRLAEAIAYFTAAAEANEAFGVVEAVRANLHALFLTQAKLLRWQDALTTSTRLRALQPRIDDPALLVSGNALHATALTALGREQEAASLLAETAARWPDARGELTRFLHLARAELALQRGDGATASAEAARASSVWPPHENDDAEERARLNLLRQRASILAGAPHAAEVAAGTDGDPPSALLARAEWALHEGLPAEADLRAAWSKAEADGVPEQIARVAQTYVGWLIGAGRLDEAGALAGRVAPWSGQDFDCALLQVRLFHDAGEVDAWAAALRQAQGLAGERTIPAPLLKSPLQSGKSGLASFATDANAIRGKPE
ncbi:winged helix-turn-helix domain-containing protein [Dokdonella sp.]|uniref:winged helix-turn-helix domain-containing protein n=1 Tax=Dokdonella sp. TaxID=2291710 RepID=UPI001B0D06E5|nr:winged helix-turn-helix domain-containing protein [Dokdonella sp.]MBO9664233.1 winged helix-turn-helix domain-containing protein [Dokdonella sp.]